MVKGYMLEKECNPRLILPAGFALTPRSQQQPQANPKTYPC